jgi:hypothetical protein
MIPQKSSLHGFEYSKKVYDSSKKPTSGFRVLKEGVGVLIKVNSMFLSTQRRCMIPQKSSLHGFEYSKEAINSLRTKH